jgi:hypothetical protein
MSVGPCGTHLMGSGGSHGVTHPGRAPAFRRYVRLALSGAVDSGGSIVTLAPMRQPAQLCRIRRGALPDPARHRPDIPVRQSQQLARRLDAAGTPLRLVLVQGPDHGPDNPPQRPTPGQLTGWSPTSSPARLPVSSGDVRVGPEVGRQRPTFYGPASLRKLSSDHLPHV